MVRRKEVERRASGKSLSLYHVNKGKSSQRERYMVINGVVLVALVLSIPYAGAQGGGGKERGEDL